MSELKDLSKECKAWIKDKMYFGIICGVLLGMGVGTILGQWM